MRRLVHLRCQYSLALRRRSSVVNDHYSRIHVRSIHVNLRFLKKIYSRSSCSRHRHCLWWHRGRCLVQMLRNMRVHVLLLHDLCVLLWHCLWRCFMLLLLPRLCFIINFKIRNSFFHKISLIFAPSISTWLFSFSTAVATTISFLVVIVRSILLGQFPLISTFL